MAYTAAHVSLPMKLASFLVSWVLVACGGTADNADAQTNPTSPAPGNTAFAVSAGELSEIARPFGTRHEALAEGLPMSYDWARVSRIGHGNQVPEGYRALTGWGVVFWATGSSDSTAASQAAEIKDSQTYLCSGPARRWQRVQNGSIEGAAFRPDFVGNENVPARVTPIGSSEVRVGFPAGRAFHYWPRQGRIELAGSDAVCGVMVVFRARAVAADGSALPSATVPALLIGAGADYWASVNAPWNQYQTNQDVGIGQLRRLTSQWRWYGLTTAAPAELQRLQQEGYADRTRP
jgi:hypothetical protein